MWVQIPLGKYPHIYNCQLTQKRFTADFLTKELHVNNGEVPQYYMEGSHEAIIVPEEFEAMQEEIARRKELGRACRDKAFHSKIICGDCRSFYGRKVWHSTDEYKTVVFQCNRKFKNEDRCQTPTLPEEEIKQRFMAAYNELLGSRKAVLADWSLSVKRFATPLKSMQCWHGSGMK